MSEELANAIAELDENRALELVKQMLASDRDPLAILDECRKGIIIVGDRFESKEYFLADLIMGAEIFKNVNALLLPKLAGKAGAKPLGKIVIGTVKGDIHDIGKNIVVALLRANGFEVFDVGVDVPPSTFVNKVRETGATILGLSALLTIGFDSMKETVAEVKRAGLDKKVRVVIGGGPVDERVKEYTGADFRAADVMTGVELCRRLVAA